MITSSKWIEILNNLAKDMVKAGTIYSWRSPINESITLKRSTCVGYVSLALQRAKLLPEGKYIHLSNGKLSGTGIAYVKAHPEMFEIKRVQSTPQKLGNNLKPGDICLYTVPHIQVYAGRNADGVPLWYSLERSSKGPGYKVKLTVNQVFTYYSTRKIEYIIRIKFNSVTQTQTQPQSKPTTTTTSAATASTAIKYKLKMGMNIRKTASASSQKLGVIPKGTVITQKKKSGNWIYCTYKGISGWVNVSSKYATRV